MASNLILSAPFTLGNDKGPDSDGVLVGTITPADPTKGLLMAHALTDGKCFTDDGGLYADDSTDFTDADADDVNALPATPAVGDRIFFGHATKQFTSLDLTLGTQGAGTWTITWYYWDGSAAAELQNVTDGTTGFTAAAGTVSVTYDLPEDWAKNTVDGVLAYWIWAEVTAYTSVTTQPTITQGWPIVADANAVWTDDTTDLTDAGASDVAALPSYPVVTDAFFIGYSEKFCKVKVTVGQARTGTATITPKYWNGTAWTAFDAGTSDDDSAGWSTGTSTYLFHFIPPATWVANTAGNGPNGQAGWFLKFELTAKTSVTAQPLLTQGWVLPLLTGAEGVDCAYGGTVTKVETTCGTKSATNADSRFLLVNFTTGVFDDFTWTKGDPTDTDTVSLAVAAGDQLGLVQVTEDGTTEFANAAFTLTI